MIRLFQDIYKDRNPKRQRELDICRKKNEEMFEGFFAQPNLRPTFKEWFWLANALSQPGDISIIANSDIYFESPTDFDSIKENEVYALSRWENGSLYDHEDSQDVWVFRGTIRNIEDCDFTMGKPGCDNAIAERIQRAGYTVLNPSKSIKTIHLHSSNVRNYDRRNVIQKPYLLIKPHYLNENPAYRFI